MEPPTMTPSRTRQTLVLPSQPASDRPSKSEVRLPWLGMVRRQFRSPVAQILSLCRGRDLLQRLLERRGILLLQRGSDLDDGHGRLVLQIGVAQIRRQQTEALDVFHPAQARDDQAPFLGGLRRLVGPLEPLHHGFGRALVFLRRRGGQLDDGASARRCWMGFALFCTTANRSSIGAGSGQRASCSMALDGHRFIGIVQAGHNDRQGLGIAQRGQDPDPGILRAGISGLFQLGQHGFAARAALPVRVQTPTTASSAASRTASSWAALVRAISAGNSPRPARELERAQRGHAHLRDRRPAACLSSSPRGVGHAAAFQQPDELDARSAHRRRLASAWMICASMAAPSIRPRPFRATADSSGLRLSANACSSTRASAAPPILPRTSKAVLRTSGFVAGGLGLEQLERLRVVAVHQRREQLDLKLGRGLVEFGVQRAGQRIAGNLADGGQRGVAEDALRGSQLFDEQWHAVVLSGNDRAACGRRPIRLARRWRLRTPS